MADIQSFRAIRYDLGRVGALSDVIAPPYDVIDDSLRNKLATRHPHNVVHIDLPVAEPNESPGDDRYTRAALRYRDWQREGVLKQDSARGLYVYHQEFTVDGAKHLRRGFLTRVRLEPFSKGIIQPHEETLSGPKADRRRLMDATAANLSPVFGLFPDDDNAVQNLLDTATRGQPPTEAVDIVGVTSRVWPVTDQHVISQVQGLMGPKPILIADGHHRYETALSYRGETPAEGDAAINFVMMTLVGMSDPGLLVLPTHRLVSGLGAISADALTAKLAPHFTVTRHASAEAAWDHLSIEVGQGGLAFGTRDGQWLLAEPHDLDVMAQLAPEHGDAWRSLSVSVLHRLVLGKLLPAGECRYVHLLNEVTESAGTWDLGVLVPAVDVSMVAEIAAAGEKMPPKSTYFYPKLQTGLAFHGLGGH